MHSVEGAVNVFAYVLIMQALTYLNNVLSFPIFISHLSSSYVESMTSNQFPKTQKHVDSIGSYNGEHDKYK